MTEKQSHLHSELLGHGAPLLMLHGWGHTLKKLKPLGELLSHQSQVHLIDLPGFGQSHPPDTTWGTFDYANRLVQYMDAHHISQTDLLGHSFGGKIALSFAIRYPKRVRRLVLLGSSGLKPNRSFVQRCRHTSIRIGSKTLKLIDRCTGLKLFQTYFAPKFGSKDYLEAGAMRPILVRTVNEDLSHLISQVKCPTLLLWGAQDAETPLEMAYRMQQLIAESELRVFPHKGHEPFHDVGSHLCATYIIPFLTRENQ